MITVWAKGKEGGNDVTVLETEGGNKDFAVAISLPREKGWTRETIYEFIDRTDLRLTAGDGQTEIELGFGRVVDDKMGTANGELEHLFEDKKRVRNPLVPISAFITAGVLTAGLISFRQGNSQLGQKLMRTRVVVQGATVALMVGTAYYYGDKF
ncbi:hypothetical protein ACH5RR_011095 [Cinchona calisaya]|uniref:HIG1 domain-containing protein n=1 Tax=Cinchona calisaya TaxID=153742 RepID=A0ABD3A3X1_9GENT